MINNSIFTATLAFGTATACASAAAGTAKLVDKILFPSTGQHYRWSEGSIINLDGKDHLMMAVTGFGAGGHDHSAAQILEFHSHDGGLTWTPLDEAMNVISLPHAELILR